MNNAHILVVDDSDDIRYLTTKMLNDFSTNIYQASNGLEALKVLKENQQIDLVLLDIMMPVMDGFKTMVEINKMRSELNEDIKVCFLTAKRDRSDVSTALKLGGNDYMIKPLDEMILKSKIASLLGGENTDDSFPTLAVNYPLEIMDLPVKFEFKMVSLSEVSCTLVSMLEFKVGAELTLGSEEISNIFKENKSFSCVVTNCLKREKSEFEIEVSFLGVTENQLQRIRKIVINGRN